MNSSDDVIDLRDVTDRVEELRGDIEDAIDEAKNEVEQDEDEAVVWYDGYGEKFANKLAAEISAEAKTRREAVPDEVAELSKLEALLEELAGAGGDHKWEGTWYPLQLIADDYFEDFARQEAEDLGLIKDDASWPNNCIDWEKAARELKYDYSSVEFDGNTFWYRG